MTNLPETQPGEAVFSRGLINALNRFAGEGGEPLTVTIQLDGGDIARAVARQADDD